ncbi:MAG: hypothetical protein Salg2KO_11120 [Salibacteraceae bacterium]
MINHLDNYQILGPSVLIKPTLYMKRILTFLILFFLASIELQATHILGMNISYEHIGGDSFEIVLDFHRYCGGTAFNNGNCTNAAGIANSNNYIMRCESTGWQTSHVAQLDTILDVSPICNTQNSSQNSCIVGSCGLLGIQHAIYRDTLVIDSTYNGGSGCQDWILVYASGARNTGVNYLSQPSVVSYARLDSTFIENSSVRMNPVHPTPVFCEGQEVYYGWSAFDPDGDSLHWELDTAFNSYNNGVFNPINYTTIVGYDTFSAFDPMPGDVTINELTGELHFVADIPPGYNYANYAIAVTVWEYDQQSGNLKGEVHRDIQFIVTDSCNNLPPVAEANFSNLNSVSLVDSVTINACGNSGFSFDIIIADYDTAGNLSVDSLTTTTNISQLIPNATWSSTNTNPDTLHVVCPNYSVNFNPVMFTVVAEDNFCPINATRTFTFFLESNCFEYDSFDLCLGQWQELNYTNDSIVQLSVISGSALNTQTYNCLNGNCSNFELAPTVNTVYEATVWSIGGTSFVDTFNINVVNYLTSTHSVSGNACIGQELVFEVEVQNATVYDILWTDTLNVLSNDTLDSTTAIINQSGVFGFPYSLMADTNCAITDTLEVLVNPNPIVNAGPDIEVCDGDSFQLSASGANQYAWTPASAFVNASGSTVDGYTAITQQFFVDGTDTNGCVGTDSVIVEVEDNLISGIAVDSFGTPLDSILIFIIGLNAAQDSVFLIDSMFTDSQGKFQYQATDSLFLVKGFPYLYLYPNLLPTYYSGQAAIQTSNIVYTAYCDTVYLTVEMLHGSNTGFTGFVGGLISQGASRDAGEPVSGVSVVLTDSNLRPLAYEVTNELGYFQFDQLDNGSYRVYVDQWGIDNSVAPEVSLTEEMPTVDSLEFVLYSNRLELIKPTGISESKALEVLLYPNPTERYVQVMSSKPIVKARIVNTLGISYPIEIETGRNQTIDLGNIPSGVYFIELSDQQDRTSTSTVILN